jgi:hypothetical protein
MFSLRLMGVLLTGILTLLLGLPSQAKSCPPGRRYVVPGSSFYRVYSPAYTSTPWITGAAYYDELKTSSANTSSGRLVPVAGETISRLPKTRPIASLGEQTGNDNFANSGQ